MKRFTLLLALLATLLFYVDFAAVQSNPDEDDVIEIDIIYNPVETNPKRTPIVVPIAATYNYQQNHIEVSFLYGLGDVQIDLNNTSTNTTASTLVDSAVGNAFIPVTGGAGLYSISFITESGATYSGFFIVSI